MCMCASASASIRSPPTTAERGSRTGGDIMPSMPERTDTSVAISPDRHPNSWGFGDGQAIPWEYAPAPEARDIVTLKERYGLFIGGTIRAGDGRRDVHVDRSIDRAAARRRRAGSRRRRRQGGPGRPPSAAAVVGPAIRPGACQVPVPDLAHPPGARRASSRSSNRWTPASRSRRAGTSTCRSPRTTSGTTPAGRTSSTTRSRAGSRSRSASPPRSSRGTSRS